MLFSEESSAICVQRFDGSRNSAIHTTYRISLRSSSLREPRYPLLRVVLCYNCRLTAAKASEFGLINGWSMVCRLVGPTLARVDLTSNTNKECVLWFAYSMILPQVHLRKPCYDFSFL